MIDEVCDCAFMFNQTHYTRLLPIHVKDMVELEWKHPEIYKEFLNGNFLVQKSRKYVSLIPKYHSYEHNTKVMKSDGCISTSMIILTLWAVVEFEEAAEIRSTFADWDITKSLTVLSRILPRM